MIIFILFAIIAEIVFWRLLRPTGKEWVAIILISLMIGFGVSAIGSVICEVTQPKTVVTKSENIALVPIAEHYYAVGHLNEKGEFNFTMLAGDTYEAIDCSYKVFSRTNSSKSDVYLEIQTMRYASPILRYLFWNSASNCYLLHAPQNAVMMDVPY